MNNNLGSFYATSYGYSVSTCEIPSRSVPWKNDMWYGSGVASKVRVIVVPRCLYCDNLQTRNKAKCPWCGAPYEDMLE